MHDEIAITLPDGTVKEYQKGTTARQIAESISAGLGKNAVAGKMDGKLVDLNHAIHASCHVEIVTLEGRKGWRYTATAQLMSWRRP